MITNRVGPPPRDLSSCAACARLQVAWFLLGQTIAASEMTCAHRKVELMERKVA